jgi:NAD(P)H-hydrate epimerase
MIPLYSYEQSRIYDQLAINELHIPSICLMENAARSIERHIENAHLLDGSDNYIISILAGKGNNAGDGFALARLLLKFNIKIYIFLLFEEKEIKSDALINYKIIKKIAQNNSNLIIKHLSNQEDLSILKNSDLIIDAIFGTGFSGNLPEHISNVISYVNSINTIKLSIDVPTGLNGSDQISFLANYTISLGVLKRNLFYGKGYEISGNVLLGEIGTPYDLSYRLQTNTFLIEKNDIKKFIPRKNKASHKYQNGKVLIIAGSKDYTGAPQLVAQAAIKSGAGAVYLAFPEQFRHLISSELIEPVIINYNSPEGYFNSKAIEALIDIIEKVDVIAIGPGISKNHTTLDAVIQLFKKYPDKLFVVDADAIIALKILINEQYKLNNFIITPHQKEFADLIGISVDNLNKNLLEICQNFVYTTKAYLVLKSGRTIIFTPDDKIYINPTGNVGMAKFGTGDVLTGIISSFISQSKFIESSLISSVYLHSLSADLLQNEKTEYSYTATDIIKNLPQAIKNIIEN